MKSKFESMSKEELEELHWKELARFNNVCEELVEEMEAREWEPYENIVLPEELRRDPNYLPF